ncbi:MAG: hemin-degrading factor [Rhodospirillaceae bacterium]|nr:hemin-degrading factor [Rhodospirillaceae bacterium]
MSRVQSAEQIVGTLGARWQVLRAEQPRLRARDAAQELGVSEAEFVAAQCAGEATRLMPDWAAFFAGLPALGRVMALTRNDSCVHERKGVYEPATFMAHAGLVLGPDIDLRLFPQHWAHLFAVTDHSASPTRHCFQVFDRFGGALHKIYALEGTRLEAWAHLAKSMMAIGHPDLAVDPLPPTPIRPRAVANRDALRADWALLKDVHDFPAMLKRHETEPLPAMEAMLGAFTERLTRSATFDLLNRASAEQVPIMVFVGNRGIIQIHTGPVERIVRLDHWLNVLDPDFNLHLREDHIAHCFAVRKPTSDGMLHSVELFDAVGERIATFFGKRKPGQPELESWRDLVAGLERAQ